MKMIDAVKAEAVVIVYYFIHVVGRDRGNSGIPRVSRNLAANLAARPGITLIPVRWDEATSSLVYAEPVFREIMKLHSGPEFGESGKPGTAIHLDRQSGDEAAWLFVPEAPHLGSESDGCRPVLLPYVTGYARLHGLKTAAIFHDAMPITHFGLANSFDPGALSFVIYAMGLAAFDVILPVSEDSAEALRGVFGRCGLAWQPQQVIKPILLPEEMVGVRRSPMPSRAPVSGSGPFEFCMWGTVFRHKNYLAAMEAFNALCRRRPDLDLVLHHVGSIDGNCAEAVRRHVRRSGGRIKLHGFASDGDLIALIRRSWATVFVSRAEGYGLPVAESLWLGKPCITSNRAPMTEVAKGGGAVLVDPTNVEDIASAIERVVCDSRYYDRLQDEVRHRTMRTWRDYSGQVIDVLAEFGADRDGGTGVYFTPDQRHAEALQVESFHFAMNDMHLPHDLMRIGRVKFDGRILRYFVDKQEAYAEKALCFGPYYNLGPGTYHFHIDGELIGECKVMVTASEGRVRLYEAVVTSFDEEFSVDAPDGIDKMEVVILTCPTLQFAQIEGVSVTRWHGK
jgi:glycosyltransferase involved in cell wall biosynthesis